MDTAAIGAGHGPRCVSLATLTPGARGCVVSVGSGAATLSSLERRLLELGFVEGEHVEILAEARPGRDPFVVRIGHTTLALRRREAQHVFVELQPSEKPAGAGQTSETVELQPATARP
ncbi:MAG TPA: FeoA family protein [Steroidobacteraceae bacterium]|nr:FeoA family protein [Steroidobacteraceae bacterium]